MIGRPIDFQINNDRNYGKAGQKKRGKKGGQIYFYTNRDLAVILSYNGTGISEHGIFHGITN